MLQEVHLGSGLLMWLIILYVALSLLSAVMVGRFISLGKGRGKSSRSSGSSSSYEEEPTTT
ncbi:MAG: hypothetical protein ABSD38_15325 [Syntrophorhabdales bacterium]|jgi:hypothetical protein